MGLLGLLWLGEHSSASELVAPDLPEHDWALAVAMLVSLDWSGSELVAVFEAFDFSCRAAEMKSSTSELVETGSPVQALHDLVADSVPGSGPQQRTPKSYVRYYRMWFPVPEEVDACALHFYTPYCSTSAELLLLEHNDGHLRVSSKAIWA
jgi:hypothetical protein